MKKIFILSSFLIVSCSSFKNISKVPQIDKTEKIAVLPFVNNSETPLSGLKAKNMVENELYYKKFNLSTFEEMKGSDSFSEKDVYEAIISLKNKVRYVFYGYVNEWRYKAGVDAEPAVSITINLYDIKNEKVIWSASGSKNMSSYNSTGLTAQKLIKKLMSPIR
ncbi:MAG: DUF4136 domain-containing protein [Elusimicrobiota bacterium]